MPTNLPDRNDPDVTPAPSRRTVLYAIAGVLALVAVVIVLHLTGVVGG
jgi:hypothetical protein